MDSFDRWWNHEPSPVGWAIAFVFAFIFFCIFIGMLFS